MAYRTDDKSADAPTGADAYTSAESVYIGPDRDHTIIRKHPFD